jgi:hypothetical protein
VRFIIEKQNSILKNKKSLDNIRNSQAGHILIDYRICCALSNFSMKLCNPDGDDAIEIATRIRKRSKKTENDLSSLLKIRISPSLKYLLIQEINDFPQLTIKQLYKKVVLSSFKLRQCQSYLEQLIENGKIHCLDQESIKNYLTNQEILKDLNKTKILAVQIPSRHKHSRKKNLEKTNDMDSQSFSKCYKVFVQYIPKTDLKNDFTEKDKPYKLIKSKLNK